LHISYFEDFSFSRYVLFISHIIQYKLLARVDVSYFHNLKTIYTYSRTSIIRAPVVRKNRNPDENPRERISTTLKYTDNTEIHVPDPEISFGHQSVPTDVAYRPIFINLNNVGNSREHFSGNSAVSTQSL